MPACDKCGAQITFCRTVNGRPTPVDAVPSPKGDQVIVGDQVRKATAEEKASGVPLFISHFATCTDPKRFRKPR
jgi:hypothetical protein